jgi:hypothetical protein
MVPPAAVEGGDDERSDVIPVLQSEPSVTTGLFRISYEPPYHAIDVRGESGEFGWVV